MALIANRRSVMTLFSAPSDIYCHRTRLVLAEKGISAEVQDVDPARPPEDLIDLNPYQSLPTLIDRELVLYQSRIIMEYLDERFPHPPLMPVDPVSRAHARLTLYRVEEDWYGPLEELEGKTEKTGAKHRRRLAEMLTASAEVFGARPYFLSDEFSLLDCSIAPLLWRLPYYGVDLPREARAISEYAERMFARPSFEASLTEKERQMRD